MPAPYSNFSTTYVRLQRSGSSYSASYSTNNSTWTALSSTSVALNFDYLLGIAVVCGSTSGTGVAQVDDFQLNSGVCTPTFTPTPTPQSSASLKIFDPSGNLVKTIGLGQLSQLIGSFSASPQPWDPGQGPLTLRDGAWSYSLDGRGKDGSPMDSGAYLLEIDSQLGGQSSTAKLMVSVLPGASGGLWLEAAPNPVTRGQSRVFISWSAPGPVEISVYDLAGSLVQTLSAESGVSSLFWDLQGPSGKPVSNGIYVLLLRQPGLRSAKAVKMAVAR